MRTLTKLKFAALIASAVATGEAFAESSVTLSGIIDTGITYVNNYSGQTRAYLDSGVLSSTQWHLNGKEDLGGGNRAYFMLDTGFNINNGSSSSGYMFSRQAYVGLGGAWGSFQAGRQYDEATWILLDAPQLVAGKYAGHYLDMDRGAGESVSNAVRYQTPSFANTTAAAFYAFSNAAGGFNGTSTSPRVISFGIRHAGAHLGFDVAYTRVDGQSGSLAQSFFNARTLETYLAGVRYQFDTWTAYGTASSAHTSNEGSVGRHASGQFYDIGFQKYITPAAASAFGFTLTHFNGARSGTFSAVLDYFLSKRTDIYAGAYYQKSFSAGSNAGLPYVTSYTSTTGYSTTDKQLAFRLGLRHKF